MSNPVSGAHARTSRVHTRSVSKNKKIDGNEGMKSGGGEIPASKTPDDFQGNTHASADENKDSSSSFFKRHEDTEMHKGMGSHDNNDPPPFDNNNYTVESTINLDNINSENNASKDKPKVYNDVGEPVENSSFRGSAEPEVMPSKVSTVPLVSYASAVKKDVTQRKANFRHLINSEVVEGFDIVLPIESVKMVNDRFQNTLYGYFIGKRLAFPIVENFVKNSWEKFGFKKIMMNSSGFFFFKFDSKVGMERVLEAGPWMIRSVPIILKSWAPDVCLEKQDVTNVPVWVKLYEVPLAAFTEDGLSMIGSKVGKPIMLDSFTTNACLDSWGRSNYATALIEVESSSDFMENLAIGVPSLGDNKLVKHVVRVEYEWKPPRCSCCKIFGHDDIGCPSMVHKQSPKDAEGFTLVEKRKGKGKQVDMKKDRLVQGIKLSKPKPQFVYRPKPSANLDVPLHQSTATAQVREPVSGSYVPIRNSFDVLDATNDVTGDGDSDDDGAEVVYEEANISAGNGKPTGASTLDSSVSDV